MSRYGIRTTVVIIALIVAVFGTLQFATASADFSTGRVVSDSMTVTSSGDSGFAIVEINANRATATLEWTGEEVTAWRWMSPAGHIAYSIGERTVETVALPNSGGIQVVGAVGVSGATHWVVLSVSVR